MRYYFIILLIVIANTSIGQSFSATLHFSDALNNKDSIVIGYDPSATNGIDAGFGEVNIQSVPLSSIFDVRICDVVPGTFPCGSYPANHTYMTKKQIINSNCGFSTRPGIIIKSNNYPLKIKWNKTLFNTSCDQYSLITDYTIASWFTPCPNSKFITYFKNNDSLVFSGKPYPQYLISGSDSLYILYYGNYNPSAGINSINKNTTNLITYPNPVIDILNISNETIFGSDTKIEISNTLGQIILSLAFTNKIDLSKLPPGFYNLRIIGSDKSNYSSRFIKE